MEKKKTKKKTGDGKLKKLNTMLLIMQEEYKALCREALEKPLRNDERHSKLRQSMLEIETEIKNIKNKK